MPTSSEGFIRSRRTIHTGGSGHLVLGILLGASLLGAWGAWFFLARVAVYAVTATARLEVNEDVYPVQAQASGRIASIDMTIGQEVRRGDILVKLDAEVLRLRLAEEQAPRNSLASQLRALRAQVATERSAIREANEAAQAALDEARAKHEEADVAAEFTEEQARRLSRLHAEGLLAEADLLRASTEARQKRAAADSLLGALEGRTWDKKTGESDRLVRIKRLEREIAELDGTLETLEAAVDRFRQEIEEHIIRAPADGRIGEVAHLRPGVVVGKGETVGTVVPAGTIQVMAQFEPAAALGRIRPGQPARMKLDGFPWTQYGTVRAEVTRVAYQERGGQIQVELLVRPDGASRTPIQHGLPGRVEVEVERVSPASLVLRMAGKLLARPAPAKPAAEPGP